MDYIEQDDQVYIPPAEQQQETPLLSSSPLLEDVWQSITSIALPETDWAKEMASFDGYDGMGAGSYVEPVKESGGTISGLLGRASNWIDKNKKLAELIAGGVAGAVKSRGDNKMLENKYALEQQSKDNDRAYKSASVTGLRKPTGLLYSGPLRYKSGNNVFDGSGRLNRG